MSTPKHTNLARRLLDAIQLARLRLSRAESRWQSADEQARAARRRRKEAKQAARRTKKQAKDASREFADAEKALATAEDRFAAAIKQTANKGKASAMRRAAKVRRVPKSVALKDSPRTASVQPAGKTARRKVGRTAVLSEGHFAALRRRKRTSNSVNGRRARPLKRAGAIAKSAARAGRVARQEKSIVVPADFGASVAPTTLSPETVAGAVALLGNPLSDIEPHAAVSLAGTQTH